MHSVHQYTHIEAAKAIYNAAKLANI